MARALVVGAGIAGLRAAQALRRHGFDGELTIVGDEREPPYNRPPLSKDVLSGAAAPGTCRLATDGVEDAGWLLGCAATALDATNQVVTLDDGDTLSYDKLVIATGCRPRPWPVALERDGVRTLRTLDEAVALRDEAAGCRHVTVVGAGFLGCEVAATLAARGTAVALIDVVAYPMPMLGPEVGARVARLHAAHGVDLHLGVKVARLEGGTRVERVRLVDGGHLDTDLVIVALGAVANVEWLAGSGLVLEGGGVLCDEHGLAVGAPDIAAAGDVAAWPHPAAGGVVRVEHWTNAAEMAMRAAANLLAAPEQRRPHVPVLTFWSDQYDVRIQAAGLFARATTRHVVHDDPAAGRLVVEGRRHGALVGAITLNSASDHLDHRRQLAAAA